MVVMKFGGSSVATSAALARVVAIVKAERRPRVVVVSALGGVTDALLELAAHAAARHEAAALEAVRALRDRHASLAGIVRDDAERRAASRAPRRRVAGRRDARPASSLLKACPPAASDAIVAHGELASSRLAAAILRDAGVPAEWVDARQRGGHRQPAPAGVAARGGVGRPARPHRAPARRPRRRSRAGRFRRRDGRRRDDDARPGRIGLLGVAHRRVPGCVRDSDLDRCRRHAHRRPEALRPGARGGPAVVRRSLRAGALRREGPASLDGTARRPGRHSRAHPQLASSRRPGHRRDRRAGAAIRAGCRDCVPRQPLRLRGAAARRRRSARRDRGGLRGLRARGRRGASHGRLGCRRVGRGRRRTCRAIASRRNSTPFAASRAGAASRWWPWSATDWRRVARAGGGYGPRSTASRCTCFRARPAPCTWRASSTRPTWRWPSRRFTSGSSSAGPRAGTGARRPAAAPFRHRHPRASSGRFAHDRRRTSAEGGDRRLRHGRPLGGEDPVRGAPSRPAPGRGLHAAARRSRAATRHGCRPMCCGPATSTTSSRAPPT